MGKQLADGTIGTDLRASKQKKNSRATLIASYFKKFLKEDVD